MLCIRGQFVHQYAEGEQGFTHLVEIDHQLRLLRPLWGEFGHGEGLEASAQVVLRMTVDVLIEIVRVITAQLAETGHAQ